mgnify:CR=1 FL=1
MLLTTMNWLVLSLCGFCLALLLAYLGNWLLDNYHDH